MSTLTDGPNVVNGTWPSGFSGNPRTVGDPKLRARFVAFATVVRERRMALHLNQTQLGEKAGCDRQSINRIENAKFAPGLDRLWRLADALGVPLEQLLAEATELAATGEVRP